MLDIYNETNTEYFKPKLTAIKDNFYYNIIPMLFNCITMGSRNADYSIRKRFTVSLLTCLIKSEI